MNTREVKINGVYRHFKGNIYKVIDTVFHSETLEELVIYKRVDNPKEDVIWARPIEDFLSEVPQGKENKLNQKYRFEEVSDYVANSH